MSLFVKHFLHINTCILGISLLSNFWVFAFDEYPKYESLGNAVSPTEDIHIA